VEALERLEANLGGDARPSLVSSATDGRLSLLDYVREAYTMDSERTVMKRSLPQSEQSPSGGDIELF
jgi:hypothetical protein